jgi:hypothetical protein
MTAHEREILLAMATVWEVNTTGLHYHAQLAWKEAAAQLRRRVESAETEE